MEHELEAGQTHSIEDYFADFISLAPDEPPQIHSHSDSDQSVKSNLLECDSGNKNTVHDDKEHPTREEPQLQEYFNNPLLMPAANLFPTPILQQHQQYQQHQQHQHSQPVPNSMDMFQNYMHQLSAIAAAATAAAEATSSKNLSYVTPFSHQNMALYNALFPVLSQPAHDQAISSLTFKLDDNSGRNEPVERTSQSVQQVQQSIQQQQQQQHLQQSIQQQQQHLQQSIQQLMPSIQQQQLPLPIPHIPLTAQHQLQLPMQHIQSIQQLQLPSSSTATTTTLLSNQQQQQQQQLISDALIQAMNISPRTPNIMGTPIQAAFSHSLNTIGTEPVVLIRGARKSIFGNLASLKELNSVPYKYCVKVCLPYARNAKFKDMSYEQLQFALVCIDPDNAQPEYPIEEGIMVEKHMKTKKTELCIEIELKVYLNAYSHGYNQNAFVVELYDARTRERLLRTQHIWVYARRAKKRGRDDLDSHNLFED